MTKVNIRKTTLQSNELKKVYKKKKKSLMKIKNRNILTTIQGNKFIAPMLKKKIPIGIITTRITILGIKLTITKEIRFAHNI